MEPASPAAPEASPPPAAVPSGLAAPELLQVVDPVYPPDAPADQPPPAVSLRLTIESDGSVVEAEVVESAGPSFDAAAREAVLHFRFKPAMRDGVAMRARILYRLQFQRPAPPPRAASPIAPPAEPPPPSPAGTAPPAEPTSPAPASRALEVRVEGRQREEERLEQSAEAVTVVTLKRARRESAELGEVLSRIPGMSVRRAGGLGSEERISMGGLTDNQIGTFIDGVPMEVAFFPFGVASFPVNLADRVEIYKGMVPIRFGADTLGGAVNIVTDRRRETSLGGSAQIASFGEQRFTLDGNWRHEPSGFFLRTNGFFDHADNDYDVDVEVPDERGRLSPARVPRFHDDYRAFGGTIETGLLDRPWARTLSISAYAVKLDKEIPHNLVMTVPYGEPRWGQSAVGVTGRWEVLPTPELRVELIGAYAYRTSTFVDKSMWVYDWYGERVNERRIGGEIERDPKDQEYWWDHALGRVVAEYHLNPTNILTLASTPDFTDATGDERIQSNPNARDPLTAKRERFSLVSGLEYETNLFSMPDAGRDATHDEDGGEADYRFQNTFFVKHYYYRSSSEEVVAGGAFRDRDVDINRFGIGDGIRHRFFREFMVKASYEYAARLPTPDEVFGNGILIQPNLLLQPEVSHNANLTAKLELRKLPIGEVIVELTGFYRDADKQIVLLGNDRYFTHQNVYRARTIGLEGQLDWTSPNDYVTLSGNVTVQENRNASSKGTFGEFEGDRIPGRPYLFANWEARTHFEGLLFERDELEPFYIGRYVHEFYRGWESQGLRQFKQTVDMQIIHGVGVSYTLNFRPQTVTATLELHNFTDTRNFDFYGVEKPGRRVSLKISGNVF